MYGATMRAPLLQLGLRARVHHRGTVQLVVHQEGPTKPASPPLLSGGPSGPAPFPFLYLIAHHSPTQPGECATEAKDVSHALYPDLCFTQLARKSTASVADFSEALLDGVCIINANLSCLLMPRLQQRLDKFVSGY